MATPITREEYEKRFGKPAPVQQQVAQKKAPVPITRAEAEAMMSRKTTTPKAVLPIGQSFGLSFIPSKEQVTDFTGDIKETGSSIMNTLKRTGGKLKSTLEAGASGEQGVIDTGLQTAAFLGLSGPFGIATDIGIGLGKLALPQGAEDYIGQKFQKGAEKVISSKPVQAGIEAYQGASPRTQRNLEAGFEVASALPLPPIYRASKVLAPKVADAIVDTTRKVAEPVQDFVAKKQSNLFAKAVDDLEQTYTDIFSGTTIGKKKVDKIQTKTDNLNRAGTTGVTPQRVLAESGVIPKISGTKLDTFEQASDFRKTVEPLREANRNALSEIDSLGVKYDVDQLKNLAIKEAKTPLNINSGKFETMQRNILREYNALKRQYPDGVSLQQIDDIKSARWDNVFSNKGLVDADVLKKNSDYAIAKSLQKHIEDVATKSGNTKVAQLNREIGSRLDAAKFLEELNGKTLKGGRLLKYITTAIGSSLGQSAIGKIVGAFGGNMVGNIIISSQVSNPLKRAILRAVKETNPQAYLETVEWLATQSDARKNRLLLPAGDKEAIRLFDGIQREASGAVKESPITLLPAQKGPVGIDPRTGKFMKTYTQEAQSKSPTSQQTKPATANVVNKANIPPQSNTLPKKSSGLINTLKKKIDETPNKQGGFIKLPQGKGEQSGLSAKSSLPKNTKETFIGKVEEGYKPAPLTTKLLRKLEGKTTVSKQFISDLTNSPDLKQVEKDLIRAKLQGKGDKINVAEFGKEVESELLPLKRKSSIPSGVDTSDVDSYLIAKDRYKGRYATKYETITLPDNMRGNVKDYAENIYESPIKTSAGNVHFGNMTENYFGHTRIEDMADNKTRRVIEVQSDLFQKGNLERERGLGGDFDSIISFKRGLEDAINNPSKMEIDANPNYIKELKERLKKVNADLEKERPRYEKREAEIAKLQQYNNPTAHFRMVREEIQKAAKDGKTKLQFPTGETAMKIEGLGGRDTNWFDNLADDLHPLKQDDLIVGKEVRDGVSDWIITDVLEDGKFKAIPKELSIDELKNGKVTDEQMMMLEPLKETFDISGKVDTNNPIYKFYDKEVQKYLKNNFNAQQVVDEQGVSWFEVPVKKEYKNMPIEAFGLVGALGGASLMSNE